ncbi:MAG: hypothetical protein CL793_06585 [Chloroflexi bacterium]|nr:hypothetical protein [Chloroflexota bacterium]|tara:strand:- start:1614 stop:1928 length:315 start_codon:yes stop_codon:yes gene_type:complete
MIITKRSQQKLRASLRRVLSEIETTMETMETERLRRENPFSKTGAMEAEYLDAVNAYQEIATNIDPERIQHITEQIESRTWADEEYAKAAAFLVQIAHHLGAFV